MINTVPQIVPQPKSVNFMGRWFSFDGFSNMPCFLVRTFSIPKGSWTIEKSRETRMWHINRRG